MYQRVFDRDPFFEPGMKVPIRLRRYLAAATSVCLCRVRLPFPHRSPAAHVLLAVSSLFPGRKAPKAGQPGASDPLSRAKLVFRTNLPRPFQSGRTSAEQPQVARLLHALALPCVNAYLKTASH